MSQTTKELRLICDGKGVTSNKTRALCLTDLKADDCMLPEQEAVTITLADIQQRVSRSETPRAEQKQSLTRFTPAAYKKSTALQNLFSDRHICKFLTLNIDFITNSFPWDGRQNWIEIPLGFPG